MLSEDLTGITSVNNHLYYNNLSLVVRHVLLRDVFYFIINKVSLIIK